MTARRGAKTGVAALVDGLQLAVLGGDRREVELVRVLADAGARLRVVGLPIGDLPQVEQVTDAVMAVTGARAVIAPMSGTDPQGVVPTPLARDAHIRLDERLFAAIGRKAPLLIGVLNPMQRPLAAARGVRVVELTAVDEIAIANSIPTAEGAVQLAMEKLPITIHGAAALVLGFGRCGITLARLLDAMGARVGVVARQAADRARAVEMGLQPWTWAQLPDAVSKQDVIFNTVPTVTLTDAVLALTRPDVLIVDIASAPGGINFEAAKRLGRRAVLAVGLPGKVAPVTAGRILAEHVPALIRAELDRL